MNRLLLAAILALISLPAFAGSETTNQLPHASTLTGNEPVPLWQGGTTVQTTASAIAALAGTSTGGGNVGTSSSTQPLYNNGGNVGGLNKYNVQAYGAKCDAVIIRSMGAWLANSTSVCAGGFGNYGQSQSCSLGSQYQSYQFSSKDVGATITLSQNNIVNGGASGLGFTTTIASVSGGIATLAAAPTFGSNTSGFGGMIRLYHTDDSVAIQNALTAAASQNNFGPTFGFGSVEFPSGTCVGGGLVFYSNQDIYGEGEYASQIMLPANANTDMFTSYHYSTYINNTFSGNNYFGGVLGSKFHDILLDGNAAANTSTGSGTAQGFGDGIRAFADNFQMDSVHIDYFAGDDLDLNGQVSGGCPATIFGSDFNFPNAMVAPAACMEDYIHNIYLTGAKHWGLVWNGPHDSVLDSMWLTANQSGAIIFTNAGGNSATSWPGNFTLNNVHTYANNINGGKLDVDLEQGSLTCFECFFEGGVALRATSKFINSFLSTTGGTSTTLYTGQFTPTNTVINSFNNQGGNQQSDAWVNTSVGAMSGNPYTPSTSLLSFGLGYQAFNTNSNPVTYQSCSGNTCGNAYNMAVSNTTSSAKFNFSVGSTPTGSRTTAMSFDINGNSAFGPGANAGVNGVGVDFSAYNTSSNSAMNMPGGSTATRPICTGALAGAIRYNFSNTAFEYCNGNGSWFTLTSGTVALNTPNVFTAGQSVVPVTVPISTNSFTPNFGASNSFVVTLSHSACPCTLANPAGWTPGQSGLIYVVQSGSGSDTIGTYGSQYIVSGGTFPTLSTGAGAIDVLSYTTVTIGASNYVLLNASLNFHN